MPLSGARVAIVHDWFQGFFGSERTVEAMVSDVFAAAERVDVFTLFAATEVLPASLAQSIVKQSVLTRVPFARPRNSRPGYYRYLLPYMPFYFRSLDLRDYDVVVSSAHTFAHALRVPRSALHVCYCYAPLQYSWMPERIRDRLPGLRGAILRAMAGWLRRQDYAAAQRVDAYFTLSTAMRARIHAFYRRDATICFPPVDTQDFRADTKDRDHFLWVHRLVPYKRPLLVAEAFRDLPQRLTMVGVGPLEAKLRSRLPPNVRLLDWLDRADLVEIFAGAGGFVHVGEEDFGISMVEALASGTPVIALKAGGAADIVRDGRDGILVEDATVGAIRVAISRVRERAWPTRELQARAATFTRGNFVAEFRQHVIELLNTPQVRRHG
jgi:glycosyltransferase involved in cell wall biosynthesis